MKLDLPLAGFALLMAILAGCGRDDVKVYKLDTKESSAASSTITSQVAPPSPAMSSMAGDIPAPDNSALPKLNYILPSGWKDKGPTQWRVASFEVVENGKTADVSIIPLGGAAGGDAANVNRWRGQVGLPPIDATEMEKIAETVEIAGMKGQLHDIAGTSPGSGDDIRILGAILHGTDAAWYFKMMGDSSVVQSQKPAFITFLKELTFSGSPAVTPTDLGQLPPSHPPIPGMPASSTNSANQ